MRFVLASASPRRAALLTSAGFTFEVVAADIDERVEPGEGAAAYVERLARAKASAVPAGAGTIVLSADTAVVVDGEILGKPVDAADARRMLTRLSGRTHQVVTGVAMTWGERQAATVEQTLVRVARLDPGEVDWYVTSGEGLDKAGAYAIQGLASRFIMGIEGSYANVVGLPVARVYEMLKAFGVEP